MQFFVLLFVWRKMLRMQNRFLGNMPIIGRLGFRGREGNSDAILMLILFQKRVIIRES